MQASANVATSHDVTASPAPDEGAAFSRRRTPGEGLRQRSLEQGRGASPTSDPVSALRGAVAKIATWSAERASGLSQKPAGTSRKRCPCSAPSRRSAPSFEGRKKEKGAGPAPDGQGPMNHAC